MLTKRHFKPRSRCLKRDLTIRKNHFSKKSLSMRKFQISQKSLEARRLTEERAPSKLLKRSMNIKQELLNFHEKCQRLFQSFQCSNLRRLNCNKRRKKRKVFWSRQCKEWRTEWLQPTMPMPNGKRTSETGRERTRTEWNESKENNQRIRYHQMGLKRQHCQGLIVILTQRQIFRNLTEASCPSNLASQVLTFVISLNLNQQRQNIDYKL